MTRLRATRFQRIFTLGCVFVMPIFFILFFVIAWCDPRFSLRYVTLLLLLAPALFVYSYGSVVTQLTVENDGQMKWSSLFRRGSMSLADIRGIDIRHGNRGFIYVRSAGARLFMYSSMPGAVETMKAIVKDNPNIYLKN